MPKIRVDQINECVICREKAMKIQRVSSVLIFLGMLISSDSFANRQVRETVNDLFGPAGRFPSSTALTAEVSNPGDANPICTRKGEGQGQGRIFKTSHQRSPAQYDITLQSRRDLVEGLINDGPRGREFTTMRLGNGRCYRVMNDAPRLADGTYINLTFPEAQRLAATWGWQIPTASQIDDIQDYSRSIGSTYRAETRTPNSGVTTQLRSANEMMNDTYMHNIAEDGENRLVDGHFKWYDNRGRINGFYRSGTNYWQNSPSAHHVGDPGYWDYSHSVRLIQETSCP